MGEAKETMALLGVTIVTPIRSDPRAISRGGPHSTGKMGTRVPIFTASPTFYDSVIVAGWDPVLPDCSVMITLGVQFQARSQLKFLVYCLSCEESGPEDCAYQQR